MAEETLDLTPEAAAALGTQLASAFSARTAEPGIPRREPDETWELGDGQAWVFRVPGHETLTKPVIIADGFGPDASTLDEWAGLWGLGSGGGHPWGTQLHERSRDVIVLGYKSRNAPIRTNAVVAVDCIRRAIAEQADKGVPLVVGGLSMGGLVTRYALAQMEKQGEDHRTATYFSYDSPHRGAWIPISLQVFAHFLAALADTVLVPEPDKEKLRGMSKLINSTAARELLWKHTQTHDKVGPTFDADAKRTEFVAALEAVGNWPESPRKVAVANGRGDGQGLEGVVAGAENLVWPAAGGKPGATLYVQAGGADQLVAKLTRALWAGEIKVETSGIPALDAAPGGTLDSFGIAAHALEEAGYAAAAAFPDVCFVPVASAVDLAEPSTPYEPVNAMDKAASGLDDFKVASQNEGHTLLTGELCDWLTEEFDRE